MQTVLIILGYLKWHYGKAIGSLSIIWNNFLNFTFDFFSLRSLFRNFFDPWKRMSDSYPKSFDLKKYFFTFITNMIVRAVGMTMRTALIIVGLVCYASLALLYPVALLVWICLPLIIIALLTIGLGLIIK